MSRDDLRSDGGLSITAEEFERLKQANSSTPPEQRQRCPECGGPGPVRKSNRGNQAQKPGQYRCRRPGCYAHFEEPVTGYESAEAVVEDREESQELLTDGGVTEDADRYRIAHVFADYGSEAEALSTYGDVYRFTIDPRPNPFDVEMTQVDLMKETPSIEAHLAFGHPNCAPWSDMPTVDPDDHENQIPRAREVCQEIADHYVIENKPRAPLRDPVVLNGRMFGLPLAYERAFETSFHVSQPPRERTLGGKTVTPYFYPDRTTEWWHGVKGLRHRYPKEHVAKNSLPLAYVDHLCRAWLEATSERDGQIPQDNNGRAPRELPDDQAELVSPDDGRTGRSVETDDDPEVRTDGGTDASGREQIDLTERQRERFEAIRVECKEADPDLPAPSDEQLFSSLLDTWDAVKEGHYSDFSQEDHETFRDAIEMWGLEAQIDMAVEECGEVIVALQHLQRDRADREEVIEELADLRIMFEQLRWYFGEDFVDPVVQRKMDRLRERLEGRR